MEKPVVPSDDLSERSGYTAPRLTRWGSVADLTHVGQTNPGDDYLPGDANGKENGSTFPNGFYLWPSIPDSFLRGYMRETVNAVVIFDSVGDHDAVLRLTRERGAVSAARSAEKRAELREDRLALSAQRSVGEALAHGFISDLKDGYKSMLGRFLEEGTELSGGQWQKLALARTFYRNTPFAVLDEPTSGLDPESEALLLKRLRRWAADKSVLLVTHRVAAARIADRIYVMRGGRIAEHGSHDELCRLDGLYARMYRMQLDQIQGLGF